MKHLIFPDYVPRPWRYALLVLLLLGLFWGAQARAQAQVNAPRMALLIGNSTYTRVWGPLRTTSNDAQDLGRRLSELGWQTTVTTNRSLVNMREDVRNFVERATQARAGQLLVYFAGHGLDLNGSQYLIPVNLESTNEQDVEDGALSLQILLNRLHPAPGIKLVMLDACRNRPGTRGSVGGLGSPEGNGPLPNGVIVAYATQAGRVSLDGLGCETCNGIYASGLLMALNKVSQTGGRYFDVMLSVEEEVLKLSGNEQSPTTYSPVTVQSRFVFADVQPAPVLLPTQTPLSDTSSWTDYSVPIEYNWLYDTGDKFDPMKTSSTKVDTETVPTLLHGRYQILGDGSEVKDSQTALIWARCSLGQKWDGSGCAGMAKKFTFDQAQRFASEVEASIQQGTNKWRIPTLNELQSLVWCGSGEYVSWAWPSTESVRSIYARCEGDFNRPTIRNDVFPQTASGIWPFTFFWGTYWTSSPNLDNSSSAWGVNFSNGSVRVGGDHFGSTVRLVSSSQSISSVTTTVSPTVPVSKESSNGFSDWDTTFSFPIDRYQISADGSEVKDNETGLTWVRCSVGQTWDGTRCVGKALKFTFSQAQQQARNGRRLPTARELASLVWCSTWQTNDRDDPDGKGAINNRCVGNFNKPSIRSDVFLQTPSFWYWSTSPYVRDSNYAWSVNFSDGIVMGYGRRNGSHVRLVVVPPSRQ